MSLYVRVNCNFYSHRKTARLRSILGDDALWIVPRLWSYAAENQPDGIFKDYSAAEIANLIGYTKDASQMLQALLQAGFADSDPLRIHDWQEYNGYHTTYADRAKKAAAVRWEKERTKEKGTEAELKGGEKRQAMLQASPQVAARVSRPREGWQLTKDRKALIEQIKAEKDKATPDKELLQGLRIELKTVNDELRNRGRTSTATPTAADDAPGSVTRNTGTYNEGRVPLTMEQVEAIQARRSEKARSEKANTELQQPTPAAPTTDERRTLSDTERQELAAKLKRFKGKL